MCYAVSVHYNRRYEGVTTAVSYDTLLITKLRRKSILIRNISVYICAMFGENFFIANPRNTNFITNSGINRELDAHSPV